ncbi:MAG: PilZ domain-containing protein [Sulfurospirillaceae bacterium]|nr:PilZ domain-containing protein [Sulfurospirillaceae bacterium]
MKEKKIQEYTHSINFAHIYFGDQVLKTLKEYEQDFQKFSSYNIVQNGTSLEPAELIFVELKSIDKDTLKSLSDIVKFYAKRDIYIFCDDCENKFILKFAIHYGIQKVLPLDNKKEDIQKLLLLALKKLTIKNEEHAQLLICKKINSFFPLFIFHKETLTFANEKAKALFGEDDLEKLGDAFKNLESTNSLIKSDISLNKKVALIQTDGIEKNYDFHSTVFSKSEDKLIFVTQNENNKKEKISQSSLNRFEFIEILKDKLAQNIENQPLNLMFVNIENYEKLMQTNSNIKLHDFTKNFIELLLKHKDSDQDIAQWSQRLFILLNENEKFEDFVQKVEFFHKKLSYNESESEIIPIINSSALNISDIGIEGVINIIEKINNRSCTSDDFNEIDFVEFSHLDNFESKNDQIHYYFKTCISNKTPIKLLNIYKGLCINTASKILKISEGSYFVECQNLQGYSMQFEKKTVIQAPGLPYDVQADIVYLNLDKHYAVLDNLKFLDKSANNRQHTRVQPSFRTPVNIKTIKNSYQGELLDISTQSIAIRFNQAINGILVGDQVDLVFKLPDDTNYDGFSQMQIQGKVVFADKYNTTRFKVVVMMKLTKPYDSYLLKYMYARQKELIMELKKITRLSKK